MKPKKEHYYRKLPHYQQPGQWYSITCILEGAMPKSAMQKYTLKLEIAKSNYNNLLSELKNSNQSNTDLPKSEIDKMENSMSNHKKLAQAKKQYFQTLNMYKLAYDKILNNSKTPKISLLTENNKTVIEEALKFWEGKRLKSHAWCIMSNHFHWVISVFEKDKKGTPVYLQDILHSVKLYSARRINKNENRNGQLWEHESFDTTIRNEKHFINVVKYTINNPVSAGLIKDWKDWTGSFIEPDLDTNLFNNV